MSRDHGDRFAGRWDDDTSRFVATRSGGRVDGVILRLAHAVVTGDPGAVRPLDRDWLEAALRAATREGLDFARDTSFADALRDMSRAAARARPRVDPSAAAPGTFPFALAYAERRGTGSARVVGEGLATMRDAGPGPLPVVAVLTTDCGHDVTLREFDGHPYRAVLRPGSWEPIGVSEFLEAARSGDVWPDNPFMPPRSARGAANGVREFAEPPRRPGERSGALDDAHQEAVRRAGTLVVIDGMVHRPTGVPMLHLGARSRSRSTVTGGRIELAFGWSLGDGLRSDSSQSAMPSTAHHSLEARNMWLGVSQPSTFGRGVSWRVGDALAHDYHQAACLSFPIGDVRQAAALGRAYALGEHGTTLRTGMAFAEPPAPDAWFDPAFFPEDPLATARALASLAVGCHDELRGRYEPPFMERLRADLRDGRDLGDAIAAVETADLTDVRDRMGYGHVKEAVLFALLGLGRAARET